MWEQVYEWGASTCSDNPMCQKEELRLKLHMCNCSLVHGKLIFMKGTGMIIHYHGHDVKV